MTLHKMGEGFTEIASAWSGKVDVYAGQRAITIIVYVDDRLAQIDRTKMDLVRLTVAGCCGKLRLEHSLPCGLSIIQEVEVLSKKGETFNSAR